MSILNKLTEGIVNRDLRQEGTALLTKWERTGLLEGLDNDRTKHSMARLLENQAKQLLKEAAGSSMAAGDVEGFAAVAFPIVRRVFGGLIANELVSVQPMSLPSGLIFFLDFTFGDSRLGQTDGDSLYGGGVVGQAITGGVTLTGDSADAGPYNLNNGYSSATGSIGIKAGFVVEASGVIGVAAGAGDFPISQADTDTLNELTRYDADLVGSSVVVVSMTGSNTLAQFNHQDLVGIASGDAAAVRPGRLVRRLTQLSSGSTADQNPSSAAYKITMVFEGTGSQTIGGEGTLDNLLDTLTASALVKSFDFPIKDNFNGTATAGAVSAVGAVRADATWGLEDKEDIPEIDIKVDSVSVTAITKKLKAKWTPELGQDLNAYHNLDAEVELTSILSEQIALEIDREILEDLIKGATAGTFYWSRSPGLFVNRETGAEVGASAKAPDFTGTVSEWYETLVETINDVSAQIHRKTLRGGANFVVTSPEMANILEFTAGFRASVTADQDRGTIGAVNVGSLSKKFDVYVDPYFPRNLVLVGRKGNSFLESGYVYAPYVPLQVTPTIFGVEDFVPRKGVMTRYAKKMVRPDMYGLVVCRGLLGESGA
jgi:hypothetical protein